MILDNSEWPAMFADYTKAASGDTRLAAIFHLSDVIEESMMLLIDRIGPFEQNRNISYVPLFSPPGSTAYHPSGFTTHNIPQGSEAVIATDGDGDTAMA